MEKISQVEKGVELLKLCHRLQTEKDGVDRPAPLAIDKSKALDEFTRSVNESITYMVALYRLLPMDDRLSELGRKLEADGKITVNYGGDYSEAALNYLLSEHGVKTK